MYGASDGDVTHKTQIKRVRSDLKRRMLSLDSPNTDKLCGVIDLRNVCMYCDNWVIICLFKELQNQHPNYTLLSAL